MIPRTTERPNCIALQSIDGRYDEGRAQDGALIYPGQLIMITSDETNLQQLPAVVKRHNVAGERCVVRIALEDRLGNVPGSIFGRTIETVYADDDIVGYKIPEPGDIFNIRVPQHSNLNIGDRLQSNGDGNFVKQAGQGVALFEMEEDVDYSLVAGTQLVRARRLS